MKSNIEPSLFEHTCKMMGIEPSNNKEAYYQSVLNHLHSLQRATQATFAHFAAQAPEMIPQWFNPELPPRPERPVLSAKHRLPFSDENDLINERRAGKSLGCHPEVEEYIDAVLAWIPKDEEAEHVRMRELFFLWRFAYAAEMYNRLMQGPNSKPA